MRWLSALLPFSASCSLDAQSTNAFLGGRINAPPKALTAGARNHIANGTLAGQDHHQTVQAWRDSPVRRRAVSSSTNLRYATLTCDLDARPLGGASSYFPFLAGRVISRAPVAFPLSPANAVTPAITSNLPAATILVADPHLKLPRS